ncbi:polyprenyl synthetase family protein [Brevifollis gellanilyticus]|uniref:Polyprenyl synthetase n=1 Tax=Brevifollis gellanilyticus TaxID=748831 RepID=A0A512MBH8_9BACT|nr:polyprenyl synthetase family protein [Brevifollis gellanilyticus]GEP44090.1 polyprenyl synthetase [Brevifollis gellanilyticus]
MSTVAVRSTSLPPVIPGLTRRVRPPKKNIPQTKQDRDHVLKAVREYMEDHRLVPPVPMLELQGHTDKIMSLYGIDKLYRDYTGVLLANETWRESLASVPFEKRLLLMPKCLRVESKCTAPFDEFGLLCKQCGLCSIQDFQNEAEKLGYAVLVAEGSAIVMSLIQTGKIEAIVGISCLSVLERTFPYVEAAAIPAVAVPLLQDDCIDTTVDVDWVWDYIHLTSEDKTRRLNLNALHDEVKTWFTPEALDSLLGKPTCKTEEIGREWLARAGKRWRPFLTIAAYQALREDPEAPISDDLKLAAISVEAFHKASLIHDDIEDNDAERYGEPTLHSEYGVGVALNVGDLLIGEGYRLLAEMQCASHIRSACLKIAAEGQRELCRGQGAELLWNNNPVALTGTQVLEIFRSKTAPAFEVALKIGAAMAGQLEETADVLHTYSENLGIAYQIRDDLDDLGDDSAADNNVSIRPSIILALLRERGKDEVADIMEALWNGTATTLPDKPTIRAWAEETGAYEKSQVLLESYKEAAIRALAEVEMPNLKGLLRRVIGKIFNELEIKGWCREIEMENSAVTAARRIEAAKEAEHLVPEPKVA